MCIKVCIIIRKDYMKRRILLKELKKLGYYKGRNGASHDIWVNGINHEAIPRHNEINERTALEILKRAKDLHERKKQLW